MAPDTAYSLPELAISVVLFHSDLERFDSLLGSLSKALGRTGLSAVPMVCVDNSLDSNYALQGQAICDRWQGAAGLAIDWISTSANEKPAIAPPDWARLVSKQPPRTVSADGP